MADPIIEQLRALRCPEGSSAQIDLDTQTPVCLTPGGAIVEPLKPASTLTGSKVIAWSVGISAVVMMAALYCSPGGRGSW